MSVLELSVARAADLEPRTDEEQWLIESVFGRSMVGVAGGVPKSMKSWFGLEMAVSVASDTPFLGRFPVRAPGPVLVFLAEDSLSCVRERIEGLVRTRNKRIGEVDLYVITEPALRLDDPDCRERLQRTVARYEPELLLLDPLIRLHRLSENDSQEISGLLGCLRELSRRHETSILLVHHASKRRAADPGQTLRGSSDIYAWTDTTAILTKKEDRILLALEHRFAPAPEPMILGLTGDTDRPGLEIIDDVRGGMPGAPKDLHRSVISSLAKAECPLRRGEIRAEVRVNNQRLGEALAELEAAGRIQREASGWRLPAKNKNKVEAPGQPDLFDREPGEAEAEGGDTPAKE